MLGNQKIAYFYKESHMTPVQIKTERYRLIDSLRGITVISMIAFHLVWDLVYIFYLPWKWFYGFGSYVWQQSICWTFIALSGFCWSMGRRKLKRALQVFVCGGIVSAVTLLFMPSQAVIFGVLTMLGSCMLLQIVTEPLWKRCNAYVGLFCTLAVFLLTKNINDGYLGIGLLSFVQLPDWLYQNYLTAYFGFPQASFFSTDYFSLFPWCFLFLAGYFLYRIACSYDLLSRLPNPRIPTLEWVGRHAIEIYMVHQPLVYGVLTVVFWLIK